MSPLEAQDPIERIVILRSDLENWKSILHFAYGLASAVDLQNNYLACRPEMKRSKLSNSIAQAHNRIEGYINDNGESDELLQSE